LIGMGLLWSSGALAQSSTSVLIGNVVDASTKAPVSDVVVTATSPSLQGEQVVVTDATGLYRVPQLRPGVYTLRLEKESYRPYSRTGIDVVADRTLRLNVELLPETAGTETVTVVGTPPTVDVGSSTVGTTITSDFIRNVPISRPGLFGNANRSFESLAVAAPQVSTDVYGLAINGTTSPENVPRRRPAVNNTAYGTNGSTLTSEFFDEVNVITGGYMPEYGRTTGGAVSGVTKSGGNDFHGAVFGTFTPGVLAGPAREVFSGGATRATANLFNLGDFGATLGGYIIKDKLWFFVGAQYAAYRYSYNRTYYALDDNRVFQQISQPGWLACADPAVRRCAQLQLHRQSSLSTISSDHARHGELHGHPDLGWRHRQPEHHLRRPREQRHLARIPRPRQLGNRHIQRARRAAEVRHLRRGGSAQQLLPRQATAARCSRRIPLSEGCNPDR
jgi:hypothetical protein